MRYRPLGQSGLLVSVVGLGCNNFGGRIDTDAARAVVDAAIDAGLTLFDTSDTYGGGGGSERALGEILGSRRDQVVLATKFGGRGVDLGYGPAAGAKGGRAYIRRAVTGSLRRLRTDYIDLYQLHVPDPVTPVEETLAALHELVAEGKVRYIGHSNFSGWQLADAAHLAARDGRTPFISAQNHWSLLERQAEAEVVPAARHFGLGVLPYFPLANGLLTGKVRQGQPIPAGTRLAGRPGYVTEEKLVTVEALIAWAQERGVTLLEIAIGALAAHPGCSSVIAGATSAEQVKANAAATDWTPTEAELAEIDAIVPPPPRGLGPLSAGDRFGVQGGGVRAEHSRVRDLGHVAALLVAADHADHQALAGRLVDLAEEGPAAGPVGVAVAVELELAGHRLLDRVLAGDGLARGVRVADHLDQLPAGRSIGVELLRPGHILDRHGRAGPADPQEGEVVILAARGAPRLVDIDLGHRPHAVRLGPLVVPRHEVEGARGAGHAVRGGDHQVTRRAVDHARCAEMLAQLACRGGEQRPDRRGAAERLPGPRGRRGQVPDGPREAGGDVAGGAVGRGQREDRADHERGDQSRPGG